MRTAFLDSIDRKIGADPALNSALENAKHEVSGGRKSSTRAARKLVDVLLSVQRDRMTPEGSNVGRHTEENGRSRSQPLGRDACSEPTCEVGHLVAATEDVA